MLGLGRPKCNEEREQLRCYAKITTPLKAHFYQKFGYINLSLQTKDQLSNYFQYLPLQQQYQQEFEQLLTKYLKNDDDSENLEQNKLFPFIQFSDRYLIRKKIQENNNNNISMQEYHLIYLFEIAKMSITKFKEYCEIFSKIEEKLKQSQVEYVNIEEDYSSENVKEILQGCNQDVEKGYELLLKLMISTYLFFKETGYEFFVRKSVTNEYIHRQLIEQIKFATLQSQNN
ncbi:hypothetical protein ABPG74_004085 [Tetrahymena malaccensis]